MTRRGFTLVELIVAIVVGTLVAGATTAALSALARGQARSTARHEAWSRADAAASRIALDVSNLVRTRTLSATRFIVNTSQAGPGQSDSLILVTNSLNTVRGLDDSPEGGEREVQFKLFPREDTSSGMALWRREQPVPDEFPDAGGVASKVADGIQSLTIKTADSSEWTDAWNADDSGLPHTVSIQVTAVSDDGTAQATARRVIAIDRTPAPADETATTDTGTTTTPSSTPSSTPSTPSQGTNTGGGGITLPGGGRGNGGGGRGNGGGRGFGGGRGGGNQNPGGGGGRGFGGGRGGGGQGPGGGGQGPGGGGGGRGGTP